MKAAVINKFGSSEVIKIEHDHPLPELKHHQVLVKVIASSVNPLDWKIRKGELKLVMGSKFPMIIGNDISGIVVKCGSKVKDFKVGDHVYGMADTNIKPSWFGFAGTGSYAEFICTREDTLSKKPHNLSFEEAASVPLSGLTAYQALVKKVKLKKGDKVLINGASGGVGIFAVQIAKAYGAHVVAIAGERNRNLMHTIGADHFYDYKETSIANINDTFNIIYDVVANSSYRETKHLLKTKGIYISNVPSPVAALIPWLRNKKRVNKKTFAWVTPDGNDLSELSQLIISGKVKPVIDSVFPLEKVAEAHDYSEKKKVTGKIVIRINDEINPPLTQAK